jgi:hypothetical protein
MLGAFAKLPKSIIKFIMSVGLSVFTYGTSQIPLDGFHEIWYLSILLKSVQKIQVKKNRTKIRSTLNKDQNVFFIIYRSFLLVMGNVSERNCRENQNTLCMFNHFFFENLAVCQITWKNIEEPGKPKMAKLRLLKARWIPRATNTPSEYVKFFPFPPQ